MPTAMHLKRSLLAVTLAAGCVLAGGHKVSSAWWVEFSVVCAKLGA